MSVEQIKMIETTAVSLIVCPLLKALKELVSEKIGRETVYLDCRRCLTSYSCRKMKTMSWTLVQTRSPLGELFICSFNEQMIFNEYLCKYIYNNKLTFYKWGSCFRFGGRGSGNSSWSSVKAEPCSMSRNSPRVGVKKRAPEGGSWLSKEVKAASTGRGRWGRVTMDSSQECRTYGWCQGQDFRS